MNAVRHRYHEEYRMSRFLLAALVLAGSACMGSAADKPDTVLGTTAPVQTLPSLDGKSIKVDSLYGKQATIIVFISFDCPVSNSYLSGLDALAGKNADKGVKVVFVAPTDEPRDQVARSAGGFKLASPVLLDPRKELAAAFKARTTPEAFLLDGAGVIRYRGRIDDAFSARLKKNPQVTSHDLQDALDAVLAGKPVVKGETNAIGCGIDFDKPPAAGAVTFYKDVAPILNNHCVVCHRPGETGPFSLITYNQARRWASDIKEYTASRQMPPWMPAGGLPLRGERKLVAEDIAKLAAWADAGAPEGDPREAPQAPSFGDGWRNGKPDLILTPDTSFHLAGTGHDLFRVFVIPTGLTENKWVVGYDVKPGNPRVVHHTLNFFDGTGQARELEKKQREKDLSLKPADHGPGYNVAMGVGFVVPPSPPTAPKFGGIGGWAPGQTPQFLPKGAGWLLPKDSDFLIQTHYHRNGQDSDDRTQIGLYFAKEPVDLPWQTVIVQGLKTWEKIPAGKTDYVARGSVYFHTDAVVHSVIPHMHLLGKAVTVTMTPAGGKPVVLLDIPVWDYRWQETYWFKEPINVKAGTKLEIRATFDNSEGNANNPSKPPREVSYGEQTTDEMLFGFFGVTSAVKPSQRVRTFAFPPEGSTEAPVEGQLTPVLEGLVGNWDTMTQLEIAGRKLDLKGKDVTTKAYGGRFLREVSTNEADNRGLVMLITYDRSLERYRMWMYDSLGMELEWTGIFDEKSKTLKWTTLISSDIHGVMDWNLVPTGGYTWNLTITSHGKPTLKISGDRSKKKE
jgi:peroxiredoxin